MLTRGVMKGNKKKHLECDVAKLSHFSLKSKYMNTRNYLGKLNPIESILIYECIV